MWGEPARRDGAKLLYSEPTKNSGEQQSLLNAEGTDNDCQKPINRIDRDNWAMWIVKLALKKPYTFVVLSLVLALLGTGAAMTTPTDIFPKVDIPIINVVWLYRGLPTPDMGKQMTIFSEYGGGGRAGGLFQGAGAPGGAFGRGGGERQGRRPGPPALHAGAGSDRGVQS